MHLPLSQAVSDGASIGLGGVWALPTHKDLLHSRCGNKVSHAYNVRHGCNSAPLHRTRLAPPPREPGDQLSSLRGVVPGHGCGRSGPQPCIKCVGDRQASLTGVRPWAPRLPSTRVGSRRYRRSGFRWRGAPSASVVRLAAHARTLHRGGCAVSSPAVAVDTRFGDREGRAECESRFEAGMQDHGPGQPVQTCRSFLGRDPSADSVLLAWIGATRSACRRGPRSRAGRSPGRLPGSRGREPRPREMRRSSLSSRRGLRGGSSGRPRRTRPSSWG